MKYTLRYIINLMLLLPAGLYAQQDIQVKNADTVQTKFSVTQKEQRYGIRVGVDLYRLSRSFYEDGFKGLELTGDYRLTKKVYAAAELGNLNYEKDDDRINFTTKGSYLKVGFDYNVYENWLDMDNMIFVGVRYGFSSFSQTLNSYKVYQNSDVYSDDTDNYFDDVTKQQHQKFSGLSAHWLEVVGGFKTELFSNIYLGFSVRLNNLIYNKKPSGFDNLYIPGFNRTYEGSFGVGMNYSLSYLIPLYKRQAKPENKTTTSATPVDDKKQMAPKP